MDKHAGKLSGGRSGSTNHRPSGQQGTASGQQGRPSGKHGKPSGKQENVRGLALRALNRIFGKQAFADHVVDAALRKSALSLADKRLFTQLVNGTVKMSITLDAVLALHVDTSLKRLRPTMLNILRLGAFQLLFLDKVPAYAVIDEANKQAKGIFDVAVAGFINAVLHKVALADIETAASGLPPAQAVSVRTSFAEDIVKLLFHEFKDLKDPLAYSSDLLAFFNRPAPAFIRVNRQVSSADEVMLALEAEGFSAAQVPMAPEDALYIEGGGDLAGTQAFKQGLFHTQSLGSTLSAMFLAPSKNQAVLDMCAAPGGKSTHLATLVGEGGLVIAVDINSKRLADLEENCARLHTLNVATVCADATALAKVIKEPVDKILLDAPCSGLGSMGRKADLRHSFSLAKIKELASLQSRLLREASLLVKKGGEIMYSVCTFTEAETSAVINDFLADNFRFRLAGQTPAALSPAELAQRSIAPENVQEFFREQGCYYLDPVTMESDAFYYAKLVRMA